MRKLGLVVGVVLAAAIILVVAAALLIDVNRYSYLVQAQLERQVARKVTLGRMTLGLLPLRLQVENPIIAEDSALGAQAPFVSAEKLDLSLSLLPLLRGNVKIQSLELTRPSVELIRNKSGVWNFSTLGAHPGESSGGGSGGTGSSGAISLGRLSVRDGQVAITDLQQAAARSVYDHIDLTLLNYTPGQPFSVDAAAHLPGKGTQELQVKGEGGPVSADDPASTPFRGTLVLKEVGLDGLKKFLNTAALAQAEGALSGESQITNQSGMLAAAGKLKLDGARFNGVDIGYPIGLDYDLSAKLSEGLLTINKATVQLGQTALSLGGSVATGAAPPRLNLFLKSAEVPIAELARLASVFGVAFAPGTTVTGKVSADVKATGSTASPVLTGEVAGSDLNISGKDIPQPVSVKALGIVLSPTEIRSNDFKATSGNTTVEGRFIVRQYNSPSPSVDVALRAPGATLPEIQSIAKAYGLTGLDQIKGGGKLNLDLSAAGPLQSLTAEGVMRALNGTMDLDFNALRIAGVDVAHELAVIGGFADANSAKQNFTDILQLTGRIAVKNGLAQTDNLQAKMAIGSLGASGTADLATDTLNMKLSAIFSKAFSDQAGGTRVGGYLRTALSNGQGELVIPAIVSGTFKQPRFAPDAKAIVQMQKQKLIPTLEPGQKPRDAIKGILDGLLGNKKPAGTTK